MRGLLRRESALDIVRVQDVGLAGEEDPSVLAWAAKYSRILLTHDLKTMPTYAYERMAQDLPMMGVIAMRRDILVGRAIRDILMIVECSTPEEWCNRVLRLPL